MINPAVETFVGRLIIQFKISYPIYSMQTLVNALGGSIVFAQDSTMYRDGLVRKHGEGFQLYLPSDMSEDYEKFFIAKLLGYLFMAMGYRVSAERWQSSEMYPPKEPLSEQVLERLDYFAYAFLMPKALFHEKSDQYESDDMERELNLLSKYFKVSREKIITRSIQLGRLDPME